VKKDGIGKSFAQPPTHPEEARRFRPLHEHIRCKLAEIDTRFPTPSKDGSEAKKLADKWI
jgi:hypothetical protein